MRRSVLVTWGAVVLFLCGLVYAAVEVPTDIKQPGTQPQEVSNLESPATWSRRTSATTATAATTNSSNRPSTGAAA
jgi:hypothetical protein